MLRLKHATAAAAIVPCVQDPPPAPSVKLTTYLQTANAPAVELLIVTEFVLAATLTSTGAEQNAFHATR
jgi:hypothetical protein